MAILLAIIGLLGGIGALIWRIQQASQAAREIADAAEGVANLPRKMRFKHKAGKQGVDVIEDPREAAAALIYGAAKCAGEVSAEQKAAIEADMVKLFEIDEDFAHELLALASWHLSVLNDPLNGVTKLTDKLIKSVDKNALSDLADLIAAAIEHTPDQVPDQRLYLDKFRRRAGLI